MKITLNQPYSFYQFGQRNNQEDARYPDADRPESCAPFFLVCDGVGGCERGEVASHTVCLAFVRALTDIDWSREFTDEDFQIALGMAYHSLEQTSTPENRNMATTLTFACFHAGGCTMAHMGDSRIYHVRPGSGILYRSEDHSLVNVLVHSGNLTPEAAINHPNSNVITRYMSVVSDKENRSRATVVCTKDLQAGDYLFLCSDGVLECVPDEILLDTLSNPSLFDEQKVARLANLSRNSYDNNTAILIPIVSVEMEDGESDYEDSGETSGGNTISIPRFTDEVKELSAITTPTFGKRFGAWWKKLFRG